MSLLLVVLAFLLLWKSKLVRGGVNDGYLSKDGTLPIKGLFVILVFFRHYATYVTLNSAIDKPIVKLDGLLLQSVVAIFFFYSGYGICEQIKAKGQAYVKSFLRKRFLPLWLMFAFSIMLFLLMNVLTGRMGNYDFGTVALSFTGWTSVGNSNWFMFATFLLYLFVLIAFNVFKRNRKAAIITLTLLTLVYCAVMPFLKSSVWMDTVICFPLGFWYSYYKPKIDKMMRDKKRYWLIFVGLGVMYLGLNVLIIKFGYSKAVFYPLVAVLFTLLIVMLTMKVEVRSKVLGFFGKYVFWMYILQRIPMIIFSMAGLNSQPYVFFVLSFAATTVMSLGMGKVYDVFSRKFILR